MALLRSAVLLVPDLTPAHFLEDYNTLRRFVPPSSVGKGGGGLGQRGGEQGEAEGEAAAVALGAFDGDGAAV